MTSITWAGPRCVQELAAILAPHNRIQGRCELFQALVFSHLKAQCHLRLNICSVPGSPTARASPPATPTTGWAGARATSTASPPTLDITVQYLHTTRNTAAGYPDILCINMECLQKQYYIQRLALTAEYIP